ncbi:unnamed protein product [Acanthosepion pharaonis]|uniref:Uncharacterized protein n=1 Tax=Acanthosepion pharaonis TaxID=158019 RepID=A0A812AKH6_ACAPH|nr:unnamed protein product [Sepia pharaonis]
MYTILFSIISFSFFLSFCNFFLSLCLFLSENVLPHFLFSFFNLSTFSLYILLNTKLSLFFPYFLFSISYFTSCFFFVHLSCISFSHPAFSKPFCSLFSPSLPNGFEDKYCNLLLYSFHLFLSLSPFCSLHFPLFILSISIPFLPNIPLPLIHLACFPFVVTVVA